VTITGSTGHAADGRMPLEFALPIALPPEGDYRATVQDRRVTLRIASGDASLLGDVAEGRVTVELGNA